jgi:ferredoxin, 2Fe-2S
MVDIVIVDRDGEEQRLCGRIGSSVMETLRDSDAGIAAICGGLCSCATCHVWVDQSWFSKLPLPHAEEVELLSGLTHAQDNSRLSCQVIFREELEGLRLAIPPEE